MLCTNVIHPSQITNTGLNSYYHHGILSICVATLPLHPRGGTPRNWAPGLLANFKKPLRCYLPFSSIHPTTVILQAFLLVVVKINPFSNIELGWHYEVHGTNFSIAYHNYWKKYMYLYPKEEKFAYHPHQITNTVFS